jgi:hypothetical protein
MDAKSKRKRNIMKEKVINEMKTQYQDITKDEIVQEKATIEIRNQFQEAKEDSKYRKTESNSIC